MTELPVYDEIKTRLLEGGHISDGFNLHCVSALCAGLVSTFAMNPFDVAKSRVGVIYTSRHFGAPHACILYDAVQYGLYSIAYDIDTELMQAFSYILSCHR